MAMVDEAAEEDVVASATAPCCVRWLVLPNVSRARDTSRPVVATKLRKNQTSYNAAVV